MTYFYLSLAVFFLLFGHFFKALRWKLLINIYENIGSGVLLRSLSVGYLVNFIIPYRMGDLIRAYLAGRKMSNGFSFSIATVIVDRYLDVVAVGLFFLFFKITGKSNFSHSIIHYFTFSSICVLFAFLAYWRRFNIKKMIQFLSSIFNESIKLSLMFLFWSLISAFKDTLYKTDKLKLFIYSLFMWGGYIVSYYCLSVLLTFELKTDYNFFYIFNIFFSPTNIYSSQLGILTSIIPNYSNIYFYLFIYLLFPLFFLFFASLFSKNFHKIFSFGSSLSVKKINLLPFVNAKEKSSFLDTYFNGANKDFIENYLKLNREIIVLRDYSAGSNATTALCLDDDKTFFRKYAFGPDGKKLYQQVLWIEKFKQILPLPEILNIENRQNYCCYDMVYNNHSVSFFNYIHSMPITNSVQILIKLLTDLNEQLHIKFKENPDPDGTNKYIDEKVFKNLSLLKSNKAFRHIIDYPTLIINGVTYQNLNFFNDLFQKVFLSQLFSDEFYSEIHGDLTIENIIAYNNSSNDYYLIDPNSGHGHNSPFLDYAKLLQSLHGGYEFYSSISHYELDKNVINFTWFKSHVYDELFKFYKGYLEKSFNKKEVFSIFVHEIIHWLRLLPYKIQKDSKMAVIYYAGFIIVLNDVYKMFAEYVGKYEK
jgi:uncharacterized protein (TIRG00374 family)